MKWIFYLLLVAISAISRAQSPGNSNVPSNVTVVKAKALISSDPAVTNNRHYLQLNNQPADANAWLQFYIWLQKSKEEKLLQQQTIQSSQQYIAGSWQFSLMRFLASGKRDFNAINDSLNNSTDKAMVYPYAIHYAIIGQRTDLLKQYASGLNALNPLSPTLYEYHYNVLMSAATGATIYAKGLTDLSPLAILQQVYGIRKDVQLKYYENELTEKENIYICLSAGKDIIEGYPEAGYSGLLIRLSGQTDVSLLEKSLQQFSFDKLMSVAALSADEIPFYKNYLPSFILLYKWYKGNNKPEAAQWKERLLKLGILTGTTAAIEKETAG